MTGRHADTDTETDTGGESAPRTAPPSSDTDEPATRPVRTGPVIVLR